MIEFTDKFEENEIDTPMWEKRWEELQNKECRWLADELKELLEWHEKNWAFLECGPRRQK